MLSSTAFLNAGSSLRIMMAIGSTDSTSPTILKSAGFFDLDDQAGQDLAVHHERVGAARFEQQEAVGVVLAEHLLEVHVRRRARACAASAPRSCRWSWRPFLPLSCAMRVDARVGLDRDAHFLDVGGQRERDVLLARGVVGGRAALEVDGAVLHQRDAVLRGHRLVLDVELGQAELLLDVGQRSFWHISVWKPTYLPSPSVYDSAPDDSRAPIVIVPLSLIFFSVSAWACAAPAASAATAEQQSSS